MKKFEKDCHTVGILEKEIAIKWSLGAFVDKPIVMQSYLYTHIAKHIGEYKSTASYYYTVDHIPDIVKNPDYVFYDRNKSGLEYYKKLSEYVCLIVRVSDQKFFKIVSVYPVSVLKVLNRQNRERKQMEILAKTLTENMGSI